ncbi:peptide deformylase [Corynebacterium diphtheriae]|uniref:Peptide deformylase n=2 Tax=Corynebacterium diphtheriae TaxID=1717 RepID=Q6NH22_CORDI|nr:peptide deformylase [Corynebacterium diphtheriae]AEX46529.1 peptide deformylase [Corynebacterium diphtheriae INCA 402]AEX72219.1 peptide deformylase [Corynebacterium diphtheriae CDCE 8392]AEX76721.1 peptide deformylase [Corynebacterium diphtheriae HC02]AEX81226.1 peptide deformylase [Corynebacterium diphtheriae HC04]APM35508.1 peptide deformylase [Corynebacterium diphtheriae]
MAIRDIRLFGDPVLTTKSSDVEVFDSSIRNLVNDMLETMDAAGGVGLAANQVGVTKRVFVYDCSHIEDGLRGHIINPVWEPIGEDIQIGPEGCLSIPDVQEETERWMTVSVSGRDVDGNPISLVASGLMARCIQHETDHLDGVLFLRKLDKVHRKDAMAQIRKSEWFNQ